MGRVQFVDDVLEFFAGGVEELEVGGDRFPAKGEVEIDEFGLDRGYHRAQDARFLQGGRRKQCTWTIPFFSQRPSMRHSLFLQEALTIPSNHAITLTRASQDPLKWLALL